MTFRIGRGFAEVVKFWKKWDYCKMTFIIGRGFAEYQILKKWKIALSLELSGTFW